MGGGDGRTNNTVVTELPMFLVEAPSAEKLSYIPCNLLLVPLLQGAYSGVSVWLYF